MLPAKLPPAPMPPIWRKNVWSVKCPNERPTSHTAAAPLDVAKDAVGWCLRGCQALDQFQSKKSLLSLGDWGGGCTMEEVGRGWHPSRYGLKQESQSFFVSVLLTLQVTFLEVWQINKNLYDHDEFLKQSLEQNTTWWTPKDFSYSILLWPLAMGSAVLSAVIRILLIFMSAQGLLLKT